MKFLLDAHVPPGLCAVLQAAGHDAVHTSRLSAGNCTPDGTINEISARQQRVVVSKDSDFYHSHLLHGRPWKLLLIRTGNIRAGDLRALIERHLPTIVAALETHSLVELDRQTVHVVV